MPGRIEVLGKHTDYAGGRSLTCAAERGFSVSYVARDDDYLHLVDAHDGREARFRIDGALNPEVGHWSNYPMTVARRLVRNFGALRHGADVAFCSTLPRAAGLSTSSALITSVFVVLADVNCLAEQPAFTAALPDDPHLAGYLGCIENGRAFGDLDGDHGVGTAGGSEDHTAILLSQAGRLTWYRLSPRRADWRREPRSGLCVRHRGQRHRRGQDGQRSRAVQPRLHARRPAASALEPRPRSVMTRRWPRRSTPTRAPPRACVHWPSTPSARVSNTSSWRTGRCCPQP